MTIGLPLAMTSSAIFHSWQVAGSPAGQRTVVSSLPVTMVQDSASGAICPALEKLVATSSYRLKCQLPMSIRSVPGPPLTSSSRRAKGGASSAPLLPKSTVIWFPAGSIARNARSMSCKLRSHSRQA